MVIMYSNNAIRLKWLLRKKSLKICWDSLEIFHILEIFDESSPPLDVKWCHSTDSIQDRRLCYKIFMEMAVYGLMIMSYIHEYYSVIHLMYILLAHPAKMSCKLIFTFYSIVKVWNFY